MWSIKMVFTASKHGPKNTHHCTPARSPKQAWRGPGGAGHGRSPVTPEHTHADSQNTGTLERVSEQLSNSGISKQVCQKSFFFFFFFLLCFFFLPFFFFFFCFFVFFWVRQHILVETKGNAFFFPFQKIFFLLSLWSSLVPPLAWGPTGCPIKKKKRTWLCASRGVFTVWVAIQRRPTGYPSPPQLGNKKNPLSFASPPFLFFFVPAQKDQKKKKNLCRGISGEGVLGQRTLGSSGARGDLGHDIVNSRLVIQRQGGWLPALGRGLKGWGGFPRPCLPPTES